MAARLWLPVRVHGQADPSSAEAGPAVRQSLGVQCPECRSKWVAVTYVLKEGTVVTTSATDFQKGSCESIKPGNDIKVEGVELEAGIIRASVVSKK